MDENVGKLEVEYVIISDAAMRRLERMTKQFDKVSDAAEKQGSKVQESYKKNAKAVAAYGAVATGVLYGLIRASSYAAMWMDQLNHSFTRIANAIMDKLGIKDAIDFLVESLGLLADIIEDPSKIGEKWGEAADNFDELDTKAKLAVIGIGLLTGALVVLGLAIGLVGFNAALASLAALATKGTLVTAVMGVLKGILVFLGSTIGIVVVIVAALIAVLGYLWATSEHGQAQIQSLINIWNNFIGDIEDIGWVGAIIQAIKDFGYVLLVEFIYAIKSTYEAYKEITGSIVEYSLEIGGKIITWLMNGINGMIPLLVDTFWYIYDNFWTILEDVKKLAWDKAREIYQSLIDGFNSASEWVKESVSKLTDIWDMEADTIVVEARYTGEDVVDAVVDGIDAAAPSLELSTTKAGNRASDGLRNGVMYASDSVCDEMVHAVECVGSGVDGINDELDKIVTDIQIKANLSMDAGEYVAAGYGWNLSGWSNTGGSSGGSSGGGGYSASSWSAGWMNSATGGHVGRTGTAMVHQGEDIVNLQRLLNGKTDNQSKSGDITINSTVNIESNGKMSDPFEANRVADLISKRMGGELRRITTNI